MFERKTIQDTLKSNDWVTTNNNKEALTFARLIKEGKVNKAIKILEKANTGGILPLSDETDVENTSAKTSGGFWNIGRYTTKKCIPKSTSCYLRNQKFRNGKRCYKKDKRSCRFSGIDADGSMTVYWFQVTLGM